MNSVRTIREKVFEAMVGLGSGAVGVAAAAGGGAAIGLAAQQGTQSMLAELTSGLERRLSRAHRLRQDEALRELATRVSSVVEEYEDVAVQRRLLARLEAQSDSYELLLEGFQMLAGTYERTFWPAIASLASDYWKRDAPIDAYFRKVGALFAQLAAEDLAPFSQLLGFGVKFLRPDWHVEVAVVGDGTVMALCEARENGGYEQFLLDPRPVAAPGGRRTIRILKSCDFGKDPPTDRWGGGDPASCVRFEGPEREQLIRLRDAFALCRAGTT